MILGIDPGVHGAAALLTDTGEVVEVFKFDGLSDDEFVLGLSRLAVTAKFCVLEKVGYIKGDGGKGSFTFGKVYGMIRGVVLASGATIHDVYPMMWQARMGCLSGGNKNVTKNRAIQLFPKHHASRPHGITHDVADALLIAEYGRMAVV